MSRQISKELFAYGERLIQWLHATPMGGDDLKNKNAIIKILQNNYAPNVSTIPEQGTPRQRAERIRDLETDLFSITCFVIEVLKHRVEGKPEHGAHTIH